MGRPLGYTHDAKTREKIKTSEVITRLIKHVNGQIDMTATQVNAAKILLAKTLPDLSQTKIEAQVEQAEFVISEDPITEDEFEQTFAVGAPDGPATRAG